MRKSLRLIVLFIFTMTLAAAFTVLAVPTPAPPIRGLLITGHNNHNWHYTSHVHKDTLEATGRFVIDITDSPEQALADREALRRYEVFILDYNDFNSPKRWGEPAETNFVNSVREGTGVVAIHSANNAFTGWTQYEQMLALMWREGTGHGKFHDFDVRITDGNHPIARGLSDFTNHPDELYHKLVNSQNVRFHTLAVAHSSVESGGTGNDEPMAITLHFGKGRVFATPLGHVWTNQPHTKPSVCDPQFKILLCRGAEWAATGEVTLGTEWKDVRQQNQLSEEEKSHGWQLLFDGKSTDNFRGFKRDALPQQGWIVKDGMLCHIAGGGGGDIITADQYDNFEFTCEWKIARGGNSGIMYRCTEDQDYPWRTGPEMQILDDAGHADGKNETTRAGTLYGLLPCAFDVARPAGEWNHVRIVARGSRIEHWLNGFKVVEYDLASEEHENRVAQSKFASMPEFGTRAKGHIALQDHGDEVCFRNIKIRVLN
jgi:type 1 glutamine amidotransferase